MFHHLAHPPINGSAYNFIVAFLVVCVKYIIALRGDRVAARRHLDATVEQAEVQAARNALSAYLHLQAGDVDQAGHLAQTVLESDADPWSRCLAAYVAGVVVRDVRTDLAQRAYETGAALLTTADDSRLTALFVELRQALA